jgi:hypothetical protein
LHNATNSPPPAIRQVANLSQLAALIFINEVATVGPHSSAALPAEIASDPVPPA